MKKLLLASAQARQRRRLISGLSTLGFDVIAAWTNAQVWQALMRHPVDLIVLDASTSNDGLKPWLLLAELGELDHPRLIALTRAGRNQDRMRVFRAGVSYCLSLPVSLAELRALLTAVGKEEQEAPDRRGEVANYEDVALQIDFANREIRRDGKSFALTGREHSLLVRLTRNAGRVSSSEELCRFTWGRGAWPAKRTQLKIHIMQLRRKIEQDYRHPHYLVSRRGLGYAFMPQAAG